MYAQAIQSYEIKLIPGGFEPNNLQVKLGDIISFINQDSVDRWPASDIHPTHAIYPEFDPKKAIEPNRSWSFKFNKAGTFKFHDHLNPYLDGTIVVNGVETKSIQNENKKFNLTIFLEKIYYKIFPSKLEADLKSFDAVKLSSDQKQLEYWISLIGGAKFMDKLVSDSGGGSKKDCHQEAHYVGRASFDLQGKEAFKRPNYNCHSGFLHGAMESFIRDTSSKDLIPAVSRLCNSFNTNFSKFECLHGIGHGFTVYENYNIPWALDLCKNLSTDYEKRSCFGGVFMENIMVAEEKGAIRGHKSNWVSQDPKFPCNGVDQNYLVQYECYQMQTSRMLDISNYDFKYVADNCQDAPENMKAVCFKSMGRDIAGQTLRDPDKIIKLCQTAPAENFRDCITGAQNVIIDFWGENLTNQAAEFCNKLQADDKSFCYDLLRQRLKDIFAANVDKIKKVCEYGEKEFREVCLHGSS